MEQFKAIVVKEKDEQIVHGVESISLDDLHEGNVVVKVAYSSINYKDMLAVQPKGGVVRSYPMIPGIDLSGTVHSSEDERFTPGQEVLITGYDLGVTHTGGFSEYARVNADWLVPLPEGLSLKDVMIFGTAGFTAAQSVAALEEHGMKPVDNPAILVTGSTGGVGSVAIQILAKLGYENITALVRKDNQVEVAKDLGASHVIFPDDLGEKSLLSRQNYHYVLDTVGGDVAATLIPQIHENGSMTMCGNAAGTKLETNVLPFILRGVNLLGINSVTVPMAERQALWNKIAKEWNVTETTLTKEVSLDDAMTTLDELKNGQHLGRTIIKL